MVKDGLLGSVDSDGSVVSVVDGTAPDVLVVAELSLEMPMDRVLAEKEGLRVGRGERLESEGRKSKMRGKSAHFSGLTEFCLLENDTVANSRRSRSVDLDGGAKFVLC